MIKSVNVLTNTETKEVVAVYDNDKLTNTMKKQIEDKLNIKLEVTSVRLNKELSRFNAEASDQESTEV